MRTAPFTAICGATLLRARGRNLAKVIKPGGAMVGYDSARTFDFHPVTFHDLDDVHEALVELAGRRDCAVVRAVVADPMRTRGVRRLLHDDAETGDAATLREVPRRWVALDIDGAPLPVGTDPCDLRACGCVVMALLPAAFHGAALVVQATAGHGIKLGARLRLWCWLSRPTKGSELAAWLKLSPADPCAFRPAQVIYTAAPIMAAGAVDPVPRRLLHLPGAVVQVPAPEMLVPVRRAPTPLPRIARDLTGYADAALARATSGIRAGASARHPQAVREALGMARLIRAGLLTETDVVRAFNDALAVAGRDAPNNEAEKLVAWAMAHADDRPLPDGVR